MKPMYNSKPNLWFIRKKIFFLALLFSAAACDSFVDAGFPKSQLSSQAVFEDYTTANAAMADVYAKMRDSSILTGTQFGLSVQLGCYTDELDWYDASSDASFAFYTNTVSPSNSNIALFWNSSYSQIYACNAILEGLKSANFDEQQKRQLQGESLFVRGLLHFYLLQLFGGIPYIETTQYMHNSTVARMPESEAYVRVIADLEAAALMLPPSYLTSDRVRPNSFAAQALLARVHLYKADWEESEAMATAVLQQKSLYHLETDLDQVFLKNSSEAIWQFMPSLTGKNTDEASIFIFSSGAPPLAALNESLVNSFEMEDLRKTHWIAEVSNETGIWHHAFKYRESQSTGASKEYSMVLRLAEQYLIRAEARAQLGNLHGALEDLNMIRSRAGLGSLQAESKDQIIEAVIVERRKELFTEYGHRFFDLKRTGRINAALQSKTGWNDTDRLLPLPESELNLNPNLQPQNPGY
ncbi:RagB/SusD family nutrient uptake outer membrane protein [Flavobacterium sp. KACC 22763]|uniref:RagB/SusD family nutrient uptake outer membrane protein n=1 Tax=Flavobacterium sp. KACC 22763 TaxID=3025668 RepID=UPI0023668127|nr:RagB/SusD family nutrient uptake outer membrane protein [Flavobacterium sp. KACC 22763]WDF66108.1 RagB/SusD family nutrient uptake outer membrane protein [Flavobacterium sp. KACC 22763]